MKQRKNNNYSENTGAGMREKETHAKSAGDKEVSEGFQQEAAVMPESVSEAAEAVEAEAVEAAAAEAAQETEITSTWVSWKTNVIPERKMKGIKKGGSFKVKDGGYAYSETNIDEGIHGYRILRDIPETLVSEMDKLDRDAALSERYARENRDYRYKEGVDDGETYESDPLDCQVYRNYCAGQSQEPQDSPEPDTALILGPISDDPVIRHKQLMQLAVILEKEIEQFTPLMQDTYYNKYGECKTDTQIAKDRGKTSQSVSMANSRMIESIRKKLIEIGYEVPSKKEVDAQRKAWNAHMREVKKEQSRRYKESLGEIQEMEEAKRIRFSEEDRYGYREWLKEQKKNSNEDCLGFDEYGDEYEYADGYEDEYQEECEEE